jgi:putative flippase GtrA
MTRVIGGAFRQASLDPTSAASRSTRRQLLRFGIVGVGVNLTLYCAYRAMVGAGLDPKAAMTLAYACGVAVGFAINRHWTFGHQGVLWRNLPAYLAVYAAGYLINLAALVMFVDRMQWPHEGVQAVMVFVIAAFTFMMQKLWVFQGRARRTV